MSGICKINDYAFNDGFLKYYDGSYEVCKEGYSSQSTDPNYCDPFQCNDNCLACSTGKCCQKC